MAVTSNNGCDQSSLVSSTYTMPYYPRISDIDAQCSIQSHNTLTQDAVTSHFESGVYYKNSCFTNEPILVVTTIADTSSNILTSNYILIIRDIDADYLAASDAATYASSEIPALQADFCSAISNTMPVQTDIAFTYPGSGDQSFTLAAITTTTNTHNVFFCTGAYPVAGTYTLEKRSPDANEVIGNDISNDALAFDPSTLILTVSGSNQFLSGGASYSGNINLSLCHSLVGCSNEFVLDYSAVNSCSSDTLTIDTASLSISLPLTNTYTISEPEETITWTDAAVTSAGNLLSSCGSLVWEIQSATNGVSQQTFDSIFSLDASGTTKEIKIETADGLLAGQYTIELQVKYQNYPSVIGTATSPTITLQYLCDTGSISISANTASLNDIDYSIGSGQVTSPSFDAFSVTPTNCALLYDLQISPALLNPISITVNSSTRTIAIEESDRSAAGSYLLTVRALNDIGQDTGAFFTVRVNLQDQCATSTLSLADSDNQIIVLDYTVEDDDPVTFETRDAGLIVSSLSSETCGAIITTASLEEPICFDEATGTLTIETENQQFVNQSFNAYISGYLEEFPAVKTSQVIIITVNVNSDNEVESFVEDELQEATNQAPYFEQELPQQILFDYSQKKSYNNFEPINLGKIIDKEQNDFIVSFPMKLAFIEAAFKNEEVILELKQDPLFNQIQNFPILVTEIVSGQRIEHKFQTMIKIEGLLYNFDNNQSQNDEHADKEPPSMKISQISRRGLVTFDFSQALIEPFDALKAINSTVLSIELEAQLEDLEGIESMQGFTWECVGFSQASMQIQITFENPSYISKSVNGLDKLKVKLSKPELFQSKTSFKLVETIVDGEKQDTILEFEVPTQLSEDQESLIASLGNQASSAKTGLMIFSSSNAIVQIAMSSSLAVLWGLINTLQIVVHFPLLVVQYPENADIVTQMLYQLSSLNLIPEEFTDYLLEMVMGSVAIEDDADSDTEGDEVNTSQEDGNISQQLQDAGFEDSSSGLSNNILTVLALGVVIAILIVVALCYAVARKFEKCRKCLQAIKRKIVWNTFIRTGLETSLEVLIAAMIQTYHLSVSEWQQAFSTIYYMSMISIIVLAAFLIPWFLIMKHENLKKKPFIEKFGSLTSGMRLRGIYPKFFYSCFLLRRVLLAGLIVHVDKYPWAQIYTQTFACSLQLIYIGLVRPFELPWQNKLELYNEYLILTSCNFMFMYSDGLILMPNPGYPEQDEQLPDIETKFAVGWANIAVIGLLVAANVIVMLSIQVKGLARKLKLYLLKRRQKSLLSQQRLKSTQKAKAIATSGGQMTLSDNGIDQYRMPPYAETQGEKQEPPLNISKNALKKGDKSKKVEAKMKTKLKFRGKQHNNIQDMGISDLNTSNQQLALNVTSVKLDQIDEVDSKKDEEATISLSNSSVPVSYQQKQDQQERSDAQASEKLQINLNPATINNADASRNVAAMMHSRDFVSILQTKTSIMLQTFEPDYGRNTPQNFNGALKQFDLIQSEQSYAQKSGSLTVPRQREPDDVSNDNMFEIQRLPDNFLKPSHIYGQPRNMNMAQHSASILAKNSLNAQSNQYGKTESHRSRITYFDKQINAREIAQAKYRFQ